MLTKSMVQPVQLPMKFRRYVRPEGEPALVTAGAPSSALPANGCMYCWYVVTEALTPMQAEPL